MTLAPGHVGDPIRTLGRWSLAGFLLVAGVGHFVRTEEFLAQVPSFLPARTFIVYASGVVEIALAAALVGLPRWRPEVGWITAGFFVVVFPGNIYQAVAGVEAFGLDTSAARWTRLAFQPLFVLWALWSTKAWAKRRTVAFQPFGR